MPNVVLEAMAAARPIVAFDVEGIAEAFGDDASRQIAAREDRAGFIERLVEIAARFRLCKRVWELRTATELSGNSPWKTWSPDMSGSISNCVDERLWLALGR